ncbi:hypothetical protein C8Q80DRAFT_1060327, partial [Daedaleopsis nitida]
MRLMPTFGRDRIRRFWNDVSAQKRLAARDYEAFLMTIMPAYEDLIPFENDSENIADLLFELANFHALAKLRMQTTITLDTLNAATKHLYDVMRRFDRETCSRYSTQELPDEAESRARRERKKARAREEQGGQEPPHAAAAGPKDVKFNVINTYKYHCLGDYAEYIERSGPTDNYTTQVV